MDIFALTYNVLIVVLGLLGLVFLFIPVRKDRHLESYSVSLRLLSVCYFALALYCVYKQGYPVQMVSLPFLISANLQAHLLGLSHLNIVRKASLGKKEIAVRIAPMAACALAYGIVRGFSPHIPIDSVQALANNWSRPEVLVRLIWLCCYIADILRYGLVFFKASGRETPATILWSFSLALTVGAVTIGICISTDRIAVAVFNFAIMLLYIAMGILYIRYPAQYFGSTRLVFTSDYEEALWARLRKRILDEGLFLKPGLTLESLAAGLGVNRNRLSAMINSFEGENFNSFLNRLRTQKALACIKEYPDLPLGTIAGMCGYEDQSSFSRQFKAIQGVSPSEYRHSL